MIEALERHISKYYMYQKPCWCAQSNKYDVLIEIWVNSLAITTHNLHIHGTVTDYIHIVYIADVKYANASNSRWASFIEMYAFHFVLSHYYYIIHNYIQ